jgi:hypothetical protein
MTKDDMLLLAKAFRAIEKLCFQNLALEALLEKYAPRNWKSLADELSVDERLHPEVRERFRRIYEELERAELPNQTALADFLLSLPVKGKPN